MQSIEPTTAIGAERVEAPLAMTWDDLQRAAAERGIVLFRGLPEYVGPRREQATYRTAEWSGDLDGFLDVAKAAGVALAYAFIDVFRYQAAIDDALADAGDDARELARLRAALEKKTKHLSKHDGETVGLQCEWLKDGVLHHFEHDEAEWYDEFVAITYEIAEQQERAAVQEASAESDAEDKRLRALGEQLARHPRFAEANSDARRRFVAAQLFPNEEAVGMIVEYADMLYWWDVEPKEREQTAKQVRKLYDSGMTMRAISGKLNISADRVSKLLAMTE